MNPDRSETVVLEAPVSESKLWIYPLVGLLLGSGAGVFIGHPLSMVVQNFHRFIYNQALLQIGQAIFMSFHPRMWPMILLYALSGGFFGLIIGIILKRLQENRLRLDAFHQEFELQVATLRHHYKNLAFGIHGFSSRVKRKLENLEKKMSDCALGDPAFREFYEDVTSLLRNLTTLDDAAQRLTQTLGQELLFLRAITSESLQPEPRDFYPLLVRCVRDLKALRFRDKDIQVTINGQPLEAFPGSLVFSFEPYTMEVMLQNLIGNAMKYGDRISIQVQEDSDKVRVAVQDNGPGLKVEELKKYLSTPGDRQEAESTHLGLKVTLHLLQKCGGRLAVGSHPGSGATFTMELPRKTGGRRVRQGWGEAI